MSDNNENSKYPGTKPRTESLERKLNEMHSERREEYTQPIENKKSRKGLWIGIGAIVGVILLGLGAWWLVGAMSESSEEASEQVDEASAKELELQQQLAQAQFENLEKEFSQYEISQQEIIVNDSVKQELQQKYEAARLKVEELRAQLKDAAKKNAAEVQALNDQIKTLRELLKHYLEQIDELNKENQELRDRNQELEQKLTQTTSTLEQTQLQNKDLSERMNRAEKLNVTGVSMTMLNKKGKSEKKIKNAKQFLITFSIPQNVSTPVGTKTIYAVITTPEGQMLDGAGSFSFEGGNVAASAKKQVDYGGEEIGGVTMYYDIRNALSPGTYTVQLFCDGYALMSRPLEVSFKN